MLYASIFALAQIQCDDIKRFYKSAPENCCKPGHGNAPVSHANELCSLGSQKMVIESLWPNGFPGLGDNAESLVHDLEMATGMKIGYYGADTTGSRDGFGAFNRTRSNDATASMFVTESGDGNIAEPVNAYIAADYYWRGAGLPGAISQYFTTVPFGMTTTEHISWLKYGGGQQLWDAEWAKFNVKPIAMGSTGYQWGFHSNVKITSLADFKGLKVRVPGMGGTIMSKAGAVKMSVSGGQIQSAFESGELNMFEWLGPWNDVIMNFPVMNTTSQMYHYQGFHEPGGVLTLGINLQYWNSLPSHMQHLIELIGEANILKSHAEFEYKNAINMEKFNNTEFRQFPADVWMEFRSAARSIILEELETSPEIKTVANSYWDFLKHIRPWMQFQNVFFDQELLDPLN